MRKILILLLSLMCLSVYGYSDIWVFGDSLSDVGYQDDNPKLNAIRQYPIFTSPWNVDGGPRRAGQVWVSYLVKNLYKSNLLPSGTILPNNINPPAGNTYVSGYLKGHDYAAGGATTTGTGIGATGYAPPSLALQISNYESQHTVDPNALYILWSGPNDIFKGLAAGQKQQQLITTAITAANNIADNVANLKSQGAKHILLINMPNLGQIPWSQLQSDSIPGLPALMTAVSEAFNEELESRAKVLSVKVYDAKSLLNTMIQKKQISFGPIKFVFSNVTLPNCNYTGSITTISALSCIPPDYNVGYLFEDGVHPTDLGHGAISLGIYHFLLALSI